MKKLIYTIVLTILISSLSYADSNRTQIKRQNDQVKNKIDKHIKEQMEREKKYAKEQKFYNSDEYNFSAVEVDPKSLDKIPVIEPEYDFDITDVYRDDQ